MKNIINRLFKYSILTVSIMIIPVQTMKVIAVSLNGNNEEIALERGVASSRSEYEDLDLPTKELISFDFGLVREVRNEAQFRDAINAPEVKQIRIMNGSTHLTSPITINREIRIGGGSLNVSGSGLIEITSQGTLITEIERAPVGTPGVIPMDFTMSASNDKALIVNGGKIVIPNGRALTVFNSEIEVRNNGIIENYGVFRINNVNGEVGLRLNNGTLIEEPENTQLSGWVEARQSVLSETGVNHHRFDYSKSNTLVGDGITTRFQSGLGESIYKNTSQATLLVTGNTPGLGLWDTESEVAYISGLLRPDFVVEELIFDVSQSGDARPVVHSINNPEYSYLFSTGILRWFRAMYMTSNVGGLPPIKLPESISVTPKNVVIPVNSKRELTKNLTPDASQIDNSAVHWFSSDEQVVTVNSEGEVTGISQGEAIVTVETINGHSDDVRIIVEEFTYDFSNIEGGAIATVTGYLGTNPEISIPSEAAILEEEKIIFVPVVEIAASAFRGRELKSVEIPETILTIGDYALADNLNLEIVTLSKNLEIIGDSAFLNTGLTNIEIPDSVMKIGNNAFEFSKLSSVSLGKNINSIGENAFHRNNLTEIIIPDSVLTIGRYAFFENQLEEITIGNGLRELSSGVFGDNKIKNVNIPEGITTIGQDAFRQNQLRNVEFPKDLNSIGDSAFRDNSLENLFFQGKVAEIGPQFIWNNPVVEIRVLEENVEHYQSILTNTRMHGVTNQALITVESNRYSEETLEFNDIVEGDAISLEVISRFRYMLADLDNYQWVIPPSGSSIWWYKDGAVRTSGTTLSIDSAQESDSGVYFARDISSGINLPEIFVNVSPLIDLPIPPINPEDPGPIEPENPNSNTGALSIRHIHSIDFGEIEMKNEQQEITSKPPKDIHGENIPEMVTIQDIRPDNQRNGWQLTVSQRDVFMDGAEIIKNPYVHEYNSNELGVQVRSEQLILSQEKQLFSWANEENKAGIVSFGFNDPSESGTTLRIPKGLGVGNYETMLEWNLTQSP